jgi:hypothetical protein
MKYRKLAISLGAAAIAVTAFSVGVYAATDIKLIVNGKASAADVQIIEGSSYVPLRAVADMLGADVKWDDGTRTITITGKDYAPPSAVKPATSYPVNVTVQSGPITMKITKVTLDPAYANIENSKPLAAVVLDVTVENTSDDTVTFYPDQGDIATNTKELIHADLINSVSVGGEFIGKVVKNGRIVFPVKNGLDGITSFTYKMLGAAVGNTYYDDVTTNVILK